MKELYFIRHGESQANVDKIWSPTNTPLTANGLRQAIEAAQKVEESGLVFDKLLSSTLPRARSTAQAIAETIGYTQDDIEYLDILVERDWGEAAGTDGQSLLNKKPWIYRDLDEIKGVETTQKLQQRAAQALKLLRGRPEQRILVIGHGTFGRALRRAINNQDYTLEYESDWPTGRLANCEIIRLI
jgi:broad specificity phosphatase PhoE